MSGFFISSDEFNELSQPTQYEIIQLCCRGIKGEVVKNIMGDEQSSGVAIDLSSSQASRLIKGLSDKSRKALLAAVEILNDLDEDEVKIVYANDIAFHMGVELDEIKGVWSGLTRRTRNVTGDRSAELFHWDWDDEREDNYGKLHPTTIANLKRAFNI